MTTQLDSEDQNDQAIITFPSPHRLQDISIPKLKPDTIKEIPFAQQQFQIRLANSQGIREAASLLIKKMYAWRGYDTDAKDPNKITLVTDYKDTVVGTLTLGLDSPPQGLTADELYHPEVELLRSQGRKICDITRLAIDLDLKSKRVMPALFHVAYIYARNIHHCTDTLIEVNPRHVVFYERMMGFKRFGPERICPRVNAPAVLMRLTGSYMSEQIQKYGGLGPDTKNTKSIYPYFFSSTDELGITQRLLRDGFGPT
ncbi:N-acyl amino acid synthase FeeM domain-containing protein [Candidatus Nitrotoga arctica]|uniref:N-acetyltransferase domain-containing protein n=1 Tax=Candidatus Nitrotoga arctica TaxID=453162 RepID=A0ABM8Z0Y1_9PROT|nr:hypothetical protein [Candidatus Nitrotoga arctica]CAG9933473.1 N-acetyltransferase domain-containing protein [Candidatus Nitrotoga arctica]